MHEKTKLQEKMFTKREFFFERTLKKGNNEDTRKSEKTYDKQG